MSQALKRFINFPLEAVVWAGALISLALMDPTVDHGTICPLHAFGFQYCPGCGLGRSIAFLLKGNFEESWHAHPLGTAAVLILTIRIITLTKTFFSYGKNH
jgi:Protein of unknown function (DUF2752)